MFLNPATVHVELSSRCVLKCPRCPRTELNLDYLNRDIEFKTFTKAFDHNALALIKHFVFCGHTGDPIYAKDFFQIVEYIKKHSNSQVLIVTNGSYQDSNFWTRLGLLLDRDDRITFSVDGWDDHSNKNYRVNSNFDSIVSAIKTLKRCSSVTLKWSTILFRFNQHNINQIENFAKDLGVDFFELVHSTKFDNKYLKNGVDDLKPTVTVSNQSYSLYERRVINLSNSTFQGIKVKSSNQHAWARCANHLKEIFIDVRGYVLPCPWIADGYQVNSWVLENKHKLDINTRLFIEVLNDIELWQSLADTWKNKPMFICDFKCKQNG